MGIDDLGFGAAMPEWIDDSKNRAWEAGRLYRSKRAISKELLRSQIYQAWERSHAQGANPRSMQAEQLSPLETERLRDRNQALMTAARPYFRMLSQAAGAERHAVMLGDRNAILLDVTGDEQTVNGPEPFPTSGSLLSEGIAGANGIGTALAESGYVEITATEHFIEGFHPFTCQGIPLYNERKEVTGLLSISVRRPEVGQRLKEILLCASHGIEAELMIATLEQDIRNVLSARPDDYHPLEKLRQDLIQSHQAARLKLELGTRMVSKNKVDQSLKFVREAERLIQIFQRRANLWRHLASVEPGHHQTVCVTDLLQDLLDLLKTEIRIRKVEVTPEWNEAVSIIAEDKVIVRMLLRYFMKALEQVQTGGNIHIFLEKNLADGLVKIIFSAHPTLFPNRNNQPIAHTVVFPLASTPLC